MMVTNKDITGDLVEHKGLFFRKVACRRYDVTSKMFDIDDIHGRQLNFGNAVSFCKDEFYFSKALQRAHLKNIS
jgi:hypothetical protein